MRAAASGSLDTFAGAPGSLAATAGGRSEPTDSIAAAMFDVLWSVVSYERLVSDWEFEPAQAIRAITWVIGRS